MTSLENSPIERERRFRELETVSLWSARIVTKLPYAIFEQAVITTAQQNGQSYAGFVTRDGEGDVTSYTRTRYPRKKYGVMTDTDCREGLLALADGLGGVVQFDTPRGGVRVVLGLLEGYDDQAPLHDTDEVQQVLPRAKVTAADVLSARHTSDGMSIHREPVAVIEASPDQIGAIYELADRLRQERFTVEDFGQNIAYLVETRYCTQPD